MHFKLVKGNMTANHAPAFQEIGLVCTFPYAALEQSASSEAQNDSAMDFEDFLIEYAGTLELPCAGWRHFFKRMGQHVFFIFLIGLFFPKSPLPWQSMAIC